MRKSTETRRSTIRSDEVTPKVEENEAKEQLVNEEQTGGKNLGRRHHHSYAYTHRNTLSSSQKMSDTL